MNFWAKDSVRDSLCDVLFRAALACAFVILPTAACAGVVISPQGLSLNAQTAFNGVVATFTSNDSPAQPASTYTATVTWGDGTPGSAAKIAGPVGGVFSVTASHTYAQAGTYTVNVMVTDGLDSTTTPATTPLTVLPSI